MKTPSDLRVLVVDDNDHGRSSAITLLRKFGIVDIVEVGGGVEGALELLRDPYDLVLTDWYMPDLNGAGLVRLMREHDNHRNGDVHIVVMTAYASRENVSRAKELGVHHILVKPLNANSLGASLGRILDIRWQDQPGAAKPNGEEPYFL